MNAHMMRGDREKIDALKKMTREKMCVGGGRGNLTSTLCGWRGEVTSPQLCAGGGRGNLTSTLCGWRERQPHLHFVWMAGEATSPPLCVGGGRGNLTSTLCGWRER